MDIPQLSATFPDNVQDELLDLWAGAHIDQLLRAVQKGQLSSDDQQRLINFILSVVDLLGLTPPEVSEDPNETLRAVSRDINISRIVRERAYFRLWAFLNQSKTLSDGSKVPLYLTLVNPDTGVAFANRKEIISWFCTNAHVSRATAFMRLAAITKLVNLGFNLDEAYRMLVGKAYAVQESLRMIAQWDGGQLTYIHPEIAVRIAEKTLPEHVDEIREKAEKAVNNPDAQQELHEAVKPAIARLVEEISLHDHSGDALNFVRYDIIQRPVIEYRWDDTAQTIIITLVHHSMSAEGELFVDGEDEIVFVPDSYGEIPPEVRNDLIKRLPMKNKHELDYE